MCQMWSVSFCLVGTEREGGKEKGGSFFTNKLKPSGSFNPALWLVGPRRYQPPLSEEEMKVMGEVQWSIDRGIGWGGKGGGEMRLEKDDARMGVHPKTKKIFNLNLGVHIVITGLTSDAFACLCSLNI